MDKHNKQQKSKSKNVKKGSAPTGFIASMQEPIAAKDAAVVVPGKKSGASSSKKG